MSAVRSADVGQYVTTGPHDVVGGEGDYEDAVLSLITHSESLANTWSFTNGQTLALADRLVSQAHEGASLLRFAIERERCVAEELGRLRLELEYARADVIRLRASISWRITRPLRAVSRWILGGRQ